MQKIVRPEIYAATLDIPSTVTEHLLVLSPKRLANEVVIKCDCDAESSNALRNSVVNTYQGSRQ